MPYIYGYIIKLFSHYVCTWKIGKKSSGIFLEPAKLILICKISKLEKNGQILHRQKIYYQTNIHCRKYFDMSFYKYPTKITIVIWDLVWGLKKVNSQRLDILRLDTEESIIKSFPAISRVY